MWGKWGPYHLARFRALAVGAGRHDIHVDGIQYSSGSIDYAWKPLQGADDVITLALGQTETSFSPLRMIIGWGRYLYARSPQIVFLPSYWPWSLLMNVMARLWGASVIMMNESHAGTERAEGIKRFVKSVIVSNFSGALVGGSPHRRYFARLGLHPRRIALGYDAVDNEYFSRAAAQARERRSELLARYGLPDRYFLSLGRLVAKKNLHAVITAYATFAKSSAKHVIPLVIVGSGEEESSLRSHADLFGMQVLDLSPGTKVNCRGGAVCFGPFCQVEDSPNYFALADAFILGSSVEEWGLVVNEAMACAVPVLVSARAGCAEDLLIEGETGYSFEPHDVVRLSQLMHGVASDPVRGRTMGKRALGHVTGWGCEQFFQGSLDLVEGVMWERGWRAPVI